MNKMQTSVTGVTGNKKRKRYGKRYGALRRYGRYGLLQSVHSEVR